MVGDLQSLIDLWCGDHVLDMVQTESTSVIRVQIQSDSTALLGLEGPRSKYSSGKDPNPNQQRLVRGANRLNKRGWGAVLGWRSENPIRVNSSPSGLERTSVQVELRRPTADSF